MPDTRARLVQCFALVFPELTADDIPRTSMSSLASWDSLRSVLLVLTIQEEFGVQVLPEELDELIAFDLILDYLRRNNGAS
jgi:acyl carrier protein